MMLGRGDDCGHGSGLDVIPRYQGIEEVLAVVEPALDLDVVFEIVVPISGGVDFGCIVREIQRGQSGVRRQGDYSGLVLDGRTYGVVSMGGCVVIAEGDQGAELKLAFGSAEFVFNHDCVLALGHEYSFLNIEVFYAETERREWI